jgi:hypothetical protein
VPLRLGQAPSKTCPYEAAFELASVVQANHPVLRVRATSLDPFSTRKLIRCGFETPMYFANGVQLPHHAWGPVHVAHLGNSERPVGISVPRSLCTAWMLAHWRSSKNIAALLTTPCCPGSVIISGSVPPEPPTETRLEQPVECLSSLQSCSSRAFSHFPQNHSPVGMASLSSSRQYPWTVVEHPLAAHRNISSWFSPPG